MTRRPLSMHDRLLLTVDKGYGDGVEKGFLFLLLC